MREIKFRHYFPHTKVLTAGHDVMTLILTSSGKEDFWQDCVWMQFTGLKDKNGKEIYEGDIVNDGNTIMEVKWFEKFSCFCLISDRWMFPHFFGEASDPDNCEVIGNIYEHSM